MIDVLFQELEVQKRQLMDMLSLHSASCVKNNNAATRQSPTAPYNMIRPYESPSTFPASFEASPYIRPESANILASSYTCITPLNNDSSIDNASSLDAIYVQPQMVDVDYRPDSVLSLPPNSDTSFATNDGFLPKSTNVLIPIDPEQEYFEPEVNYNLQSAQQCHNYPGTLSEAQGKLNNGLNDGCLV